MTAVGAVTLASLRTSLRSVSYNVRTIVSSQAISPQSELVLSLSVSSVFPFPSGLPVAAYVFFLVFLSLLSSVHLIKI